MLVCPKCVHEALIHEFDPLLVEIKPTGEKALSYECPRCKWVGTEDDTKPGNH